ncbi:MAG: response regulator [Desulfobulbaceae bacterium]|jgi:CheY-like chemotaxis protein|nr:response regulator [Desulfobulbaceae bacterium]
MADPNPQHMLEEINNNIVTGDALKARLVLSELAAVDDGWQRKILYALSKGQPEFVVPQLLILLKEQPELAAALPTREMLAAIFSSWPEQFSHFLTLPKLEGRRSLISLTGELRAKKAAPILLDALAHSPDDEEILAILAALGEIGDESALNTLTDFLYAANRPMILKAVEALGRIATPSAIQQLARRMGTDHELDLLILKIFARIQDDTSLAQLNEALRSPFADTRVFAKQQLTRIGGSALPFLLPNLREQHDDLLIHTLNVLGDIGDAQAIDPIRRLLDGLPTNPNVRFAAYEALALLPVRKGAYTLTAGLTDSEEHVCIAAARAAERNFSPGLLVGIKNLLAGQGGEALQISKTIIDAQARRLFLGLITDETFRRLALHYLLRAHRDVRDWHAALLNQAGQADLARRIVGGNDQAARPKVVAVDDSRMILNIYKSTLYELGYEPVLFEFPVSALNWLRAEQALMVLTDLNMPEMTGVRLTEKVREIYPAEQLPVIMVTTQNEATDNEAAQAAGVNRILQKPFNKESLGAAISETLAGLTRANR